MPPENRSASSGYPWYEWVSGSAIEQGDLLLDFPILVMDQPIREAEGTADARGEIRNVIVMSQTCDIQWRKVKHLVLCPCYEFREFAGQAKKWGKKECQDLLRGNLPGYHLMNEREGGLQRIPFQVVDFHEVLSAPLGVARAFAEGLEKQRPRLCPPYREHLAQAFARFFMRVGLPVDIPEHKLALR